MKKKSIYALAFGFLLFAVCVAACGTRQESPQKFDHFQDDLFFVQEKRVASKNNDQHDEGRGENISLELLLDQESPFLLPVGSLDRELLFCELEAFSGECLLGLLRGDPRVELPVLELQKIFMEVQFELFLFLAHPALRARSTGNLYSTTNLGLPPSPTKTLVFATFDRSRSMIFTNWAAPTSSLWRGCITSVLNFMTSICLRDEGCQNQKPPKIVFKGGSRKTRNITAKNIKSDFADACTKFAEQFSTRFRLSVPSCLRENLIFPAFNP